MLAELKIKNLALIDEIVWEPGSGLISVTGQTGAGKSIIIGALKLILLGERANPDLIRSGETDCSVEAVFTIPNAAGSIHSLLEEYGLEPCEGGSLIVKRVFGKRSRQFVNCSACTLAVLKQIGSRLIDLHGANEHHSLLSRDRQLEMLDAYSGVATELQSYRTAYLKWIEARKELDDFDSNLISDKEAELLRFQLEEISGAALIEKELDELERRYTQARNAARLITAANHSRTHLVTAIEALSDARRHLNELTSLDPDSENFVVGFESARLEMEELNEGLDEYLGDLEIDPSEMQAMENRIDEVENLKRKYGQTICDILSFEKKARKRLAQIDHREEERQKLQAAVSKAWLDLEKQGGKLSRKRIKAAKRLEKDVARQLSGLGFLQSVFQISISELESPGASGFEEVDFLFGPNPGEPVKPLRVIASSGEMSRVMLAVKSALAEQDETALMVFDEIDANVGGEIAVAVGEKMKCLGEHHQVIAITHMPQVACRADNHFLVEKNSKDGVTKTAIRKIEDKNRIRELARMLGGIGEESLALAEKMLLDSADQ